MIPSFCTWIEYFVRFVEFRYLKRKVLRTSERRAYLYGHMYSCFMKKNTLLYLASDLVERAKRENINISKLTEEALKQALEITTPRTAQEHLRKMLAEVGSESSFYGETYFLPSK